MNEVSKEIRGIYSKSMLMKKVTAERQEQDGSGTHCYVYNERYSDN